MPKTVCIVGAGPSGLVAAKTLLQQEGPGFHVTLFDAQPRIGGLWPSSPRGEAAVAATGLVHPLMRANQSRHTVQFSDLAWDAADPQFPPAWQVGRYLSRYAERYLLTAAAGAAAAAAIRLGCRVETAEPVVPGDSARGWRVTVRDVAEDRVEDAGVFDYLVVASGFFSKPMIPAELSLSPAAEVPVIHSSRYRDLEGLLEKASGQGGKIVIAGGQMSGVEIAGTIATHLSSAVNSPGTPSIPNADKYTIHHIIQRPSWTFPLLTSPKAGHAAAPFLPCDLPSYNLSNRPRPLVNKQGHISIEAAQTANSVFQGVIGTDQSDFSPQLAIGGDALDDPPYITFSDTYLEFVRSGLITVSHGKLAGVDGTTATLSPPGEEAISDVAAVVLATGFDASSAIAYLPPQTREALSFSPAHHPDLPVALAFHGTHHPSVPNLGFVGFYRSPYWGVMEMQARFLAATWSCAATATPLPPALRSALERDDSVERVLALRADPARTSQFPMGDYAFLMQEFAAALGLEISAPVGQTPPLPHNGLGMDILTPARYAAVAAQAAGGRGRQQQEEEVAASLRQTLDTAVAGLARGRFVAAAVFRSLQGEWSLERDLASALPSHPSGHFSGTARFLLRGGTADGRRGGVEQAAKDGDYEFEQPGLEYLYVEDGEFRAENGMAFRATRRYVWRYDEARDALSVWFARTDDARRADYLFHEVEFIVPEEGEGDDPGRGWQAKAGHLCVEDFYDVKYEFNFKAVNLKDWRLAYTVKGPKKDYTIDGVYRRVRKT
ncbi:uncharacterized protein E0L32_009768 [Thyridium curvatum]|uniref:DUF6314 domain-containing protein n=1 Tax=Thyridium curvatum TaxID=1093900 RepID=A0A507AVF5_9PEZI|nr:uncharacterized protein E0L32_009768 [Thyridium curvatum]TPX08828.1 hypothetical protein E0L32_009768 [Thyridium curvatum]